MQHFQIEFEAFGIIKTDTRMFHLLGDVIEGGTKDEFIQAIQTSKVFEVGPGDMPEEENIFLPNGGSFVSGDHDKLREAFRQRMC